MTPNRIGSLIGGVFGLIYVVVNAGAFPPALATALRALGVAAFVVLLVAVHRAGDGPRFPGERGRGGFGRGYWLIVAAEVLAAAAGLAVLNGLLDASDAGVAWISVVVGVHFIGLAMLWRERVFTWLGAAIALCGAAGLAAAAAGLGSPAIAGVAGIVPGALLLGAGFWAVLHETGGRDAPA